MDSEAIYTFPDPKGGGWVNKLGSKKIKTFMTKDVAVRSGKATAIVYKTKHYIYSKYGYLSMITDYSVSPYREMKVEYNYWSRIIKKA